MTLYMINESQKKNVPNDISVYSSLKDVELDIEPVDVDNGEFFLFDTDGYFYSIASTESFDRFIFKKVEKNEDMARRIVQNYLERLANPYDVAKSIEENARKIEERSQGRADR